MKSSEISLERIVQIGGHPGINGTALCMQKLIQIVLSDKNKKIDNISFYGKLIKPISHLTKKLEDCGARCLVRKIEHIEYCYTWEHSYVEFTISPRSSLITLNCYTTDETLLKFFYEIGKEFVVRQTKSAVYSITSSKSGLELREIGSGDSPLISENYNSEVIEDVKYILESFKKTPPIGRIAILAGEPGTGKTHLIRSFLSEIDNIFIILPTHLAGAMDSPEFLPVLMNAKENHGKPITLIIEDGDICLVPRKNDNISTVSSLLNLSDGILGTLLDVKMIITSNTSIKDMDQAVLRPGRLCRHITVGKLDYTQANKVYQRLMQDDKVEVGPNHKYYTLAEIYEKYYTKDQPQGGSKGIKSKTIGFGI